MKVRLKRTDKDYYGVGEYILPVVEAAAKYDQFIQILCEILNTFDTFSEDIVNKVKKTLELEKYKINEGDETVKEDYKLFANRLEMFYWHVVDYEFAEEVKKFDQDLYQEKRLYHTDYRLGRYRGILFEVLIDALVRNRYQGRGKRYETGLCRPVTNHTGERTEGCHRREINNRPLTSLNHRPQENLGGDNSAGEVQPNHILKSIDIYIEECARRSDSRTWHIPPGGIQQRIHMSVEIQNPITVFLNNLLFHHIRDHEHGLPSLLPD